jgi:hypothetical protein
MWKFKKVKQRHENSSVEEANMTSDNQFDELVKSTDECFFVAPVCD